MSEIRVVGCVVGCGVVALAMAGCLYSPEAYEYARVQESLPELWPGGEEVGRRRASPAPADGPLRLTLEEAVERAVADNPDIQIALRRISQAEATLDEANASFLPWVGMDTGYVRTDSPSTFLFKTIDSRSLAPGADFNNPGEAGFWETGVAARYNLFSGGRRIVERWRAETGVSARELEHQIARNALVAAVIRTFHDVQAAEANVRTATASVETVEAELAETRAQFDAGRALKSDVLSLEVRLAEAKDQRIQAENGRNLALAALANLLGGVPDDELELVFDESAGSSLEFDYPQALAEAMEKRPELARARKLVEAAAMKVSSQKTSFLPSVDAEARVYWVDETMSYDADNTNWFAGVQLRWSLFEGGARLARTRRARFELHEMMQADRKAALAVQLDVRTACLAVEEARSRLGVASASVEQAAESLDLVRKQFEGGTATVTRYLEAELMLTKARVRETNARYDLKKAIANTERAIGRFAAGGA